MQTRIKILSFLLLPIFLFAQEDSTVNLLPIYKKGTILKYKIESFQSHSNSEQVFSNQESYTFKAELLQSAYGLSIFKGNYYSDSNLLKTDLEILFTIDSNTRFVAIENTNQVYAHLAKRTTDSSLQFLDSMHLETYFPELEMLFFLNGAKYIKGEVYQSESVLLTEEVAITTNIEVQMHKFDRKENRFEIDVRIQPQIENQCNLQSKYSYVFSLYNLHLIEMVSEQKYVLGTFHFEKKLRLRNLLN